MYLTMAAARYVDSLRRGSELPDSAGVLISEHPGPAGRRIEVAFAAEQRTGDVVLERAGARVFIAPTIASALAETVVDLDATVDPPDLVLRPASMHHCGVATLRSRPGGRA